MHLHLNIQRVPVRKINPAPYNPRTRHGQDGGRLWACRSPDTRAFVNVVKRTDKGGAAPGKLSLASRSSARMQ